MMRRNCMPLAVLAILVLTPTAPADDQLPPIPDGKTWKLVWHDEFDGTKLDESKWAYGPDGRRRDGWWMRKAISLDGNGHLVIRMLKEGDKYIDGCITTQGKFAHAFGYYVARVQFQRQPGHWAAFWITGPGVRKVGSGGRDGTEIDIMEKPWLGDLDAAVEERPKQFFPADELVLGHCQNWLASMARPSLRLPKKEWMLMSIE